MFPALPRNRNENSDGAHRHKSRGVLSRKFSRFRGDFSHCLLFIAFFLNSFPCQGGSWTPQDPPHVRPWGIESKKSQKNPQHSFEKKPRDFRTGGIGPKSGGGGQITYIIFYPKIVLAILSKTFHFSNYNFFSKIPYCRGKKWIF